MAWVRDGSAPDEVKVSLVICKADHPELVEWLWGLPFRKQSSVIRDVLSGAAKMVSSNAEPKRQTVMGKPANMGKETPPASLSGTPVVVTSSETPTGSKTMTEATATILRNMRKDF